MSNEEVDNQEYQSTFDIDLNELADIVNFDKRTDKALVEVLNDTYDGVQGVAKRLKTDLVSGIPLRYPHQYNSSTKSSAKGPDMTAIDGQERCEIFGENIIPPPRSETILEIVWGTIKEDPILKILIAGACVVLSLGSAICPAEGWIEVKDVSILIYL
jgi:Ca2+-transporting ATPase